MRSQDITMETKKLNLEKQINENTGGSFYFAEWHHQQQKENYRVLHIYDDDAVITKEKLRQPGSVADGGIVKLTMSLANCMLQEFGANER